MPFIRSAHTDYGFCVADVNDPNRFAHVLYKGRSENGMSILALDGSEQNTEQVELMAGSDLEGALLGEFSIGLTPSSKPSDAEIVLGIPANEFNVRKIHIFDGAYFEKNREPHNHQPELRP